MQIRDGRPGVEGVGSHAGGLGALGLEVVKVWCLSRGHLHSIRNELSTNQLCPLRGYIFFFWYLSYANYIIKKLSFLHHPKGYMCSNVHCSTIYNSQDVEAT